MRCISVHLLVGKLGWGRGVHFEGSGIDIAADKMSVMPYFVSSELCLFI